MNAFFNLNPPHSHSYRQAGNLRSSVLTGKDSFLYRFSGGILLIDPVMELVIREELHRLLVDALIDPAHLLFVVAGILRLYLYEQTGSFVSVPVIFDVICI